MICDHRLQYIWTISDLVIIRCRGKFPLEKKMLTELFKWSFYPFAQLLSVIVRIEKYIYLLLPLTSSFSSPFSLLLKLCQALAAVPEVLLELSGSQQHLGKFLDWDQKTANGKEGIRYVLQIICFQPFLSPMASCNQFSIIHINRDFKMARLKQKCS